MNQKEQESLLTQRTLGVMALTYPELEHRAHSEYSLYERLRRAWEERAEVQKLLRPRGGLRQLLPPVNSYELEARCDWLSKRSIKNESKLYAFRLAVSMCDLTTLEGADTPEKVRRLCARARNPYTPRAGMPDRDTLAVPPVAAVCVYPNLIATAKDALAGTDIKVAAVGTAFPSGQYPFRLRLADVRWCIREGADEIDMVINRNAYLSGDDKQVYREISRVKEVCGDTVHLKVILETGELGSYDAVRHASFLAMLAGADFIKTSTGKIQPSATLPTTLVMLEAIRDYYEATGRAVGMKPAGGIRTAKDAVRYLVLLNETLGREWLTPERFRFGASSLLNDLLRQMVKQVTGHYRASDEFSYD
ncbi:MAG: deoxyribose-phosphate aldolase [Fimbriimonadales bacterium]